MIHKPVLLGEAIENLNLKPGDIVVDGTLGAGGHAQEILKKILPGGKLIAIDWDKRAIDSFRKNESIKTFIAKRELILVNGSYADLEGIIRGLRFQSADAVFIDLGFSSDQIEDAQRGFSFLKNGVLDMRYSPETQDKTAADVVNKYPEEKLIEIFRSFGEEKFAKRIAGGIIEARKEKEIKKTEELVEIVSKAVPEFYRRGRIHFATRIFQALRIEVNEELSNLNRFLESAIDSLANGGRLAIISFHSLEDRIVKNFFRLHSRNCVCPPNFPKCVCQHRQTLKIITKKPITPSEREMKENSRSRSAKLRVAERALSL
jgi:16S rRNA (cytosine1402-N4)-methyltransferase